MDLLNRYLQAVKTFLPLAQQEDIVNELSENFLAKAEDKEAELGRPLTEAEEGALLKEFGHPLLFALRYRTQNPLIGPLLMPVYWFVLKVTFGIVLISSLVAPVIASIAAGKGFPDILPLFLHMPAAIIPTFGWITADFAILEYCVRRFGLLERWNASWSPESLPRAAKPARVENRWEAIGGLCFGVIFAAWWLAVPHFPYLMFGPGAALLAFGPSWQQFQIVVLLLIGLSTVQHGLRLAYPQSRLAIVALRFGIQCLGLALILWASGARHMDLFAGLTQEGSGIAAVLNTSLPGGLSVGLTISVVVQAFPLWAELRKKAGWQRSLSLI